MTRTGLSRMLPLCGVLFNVFYIIHVIVDVILQFVGHHLFGD